MENVQPNFGIRLKKLRLDRNLGQEELAELCELSADQISNIERGKSWVGELSLALLADALGVSQQALFEFGGNEAFIKAGGLNRRAQRKPVKFDVDTKRKILIRLPPRRR